MTNPGANVQSATNDGDAPTGEEGNLINAGIVVSTIKAVPWNWFYTRLRTFFSARVTLIGPEGSGKTTLARVLYNDGNLIRIEDHKRSDKILPGRSIVATMTGPLGESKLILRGIFDTPGQRHDAMHSVVEHIVNAKPEVMVFVFDCARPFNQEPENAEIDTGKWLDDLITEATNVESKVFRYALASAKLIVVMLNKINKRHDQLHKLNKYANDRLPREVAKEVEPFKHEAFQKIKELFAKAGTSISSSDVVMIPCCLVTYDDKSTVLYDHGHKELIMLIHERLRRR